MFGIYREGSSGCYMWTEDVYDTMEEAIEQVEIFYSDYDEDATGLLVVEIIPRKRAVLPPRKPVWEEM